MYLVITYYSGPEFQRGRRQPGMWCVFRDEWSVRSLLSCFFSSVLYNETFPHILFRVVGDNRGVRWLWDEWSLRSLLFLQPEDDWQSVDGGQSAPVSAPRAAHTMGQHGLRSTTRPLPGFTENKLLTFVTAREMILHQTQIQQPLRCKLVSSHLWIQNKSRD